MEIGLEHEYEVPFSHGDESPRLHDFIDAGIRLQFSASRTLAQVHTLGFVISTMDFYAAWRVRRELWAGDCVA